MRGNCKSTDPQEFRAHENANIAQAIENVKWLRYNFPQVDWYCPGEVNEPIQVAQDLGFLTVEQVLEIDYYIIKDNCHATLFHRWEDSEGMDGEQQANYEGHNLGCTINDTKFIWHCDYNVIRKFVEEVASKYSNSEATENAKIEN